MQGKRGQTIIGVKPGSPAWEAGLRPKDRVLAVNGYNCVDVLDLIFYGNDEEVALEVEPSGGGPVRTVILDPEYGGTGIEFRPMKPRACRNRCLFCFVDQLPAGLRRQLYFKDEDYRYSFLNGNYVTLSHLADADLDRILRLRLSPLYISVHSTDETIRQKLLGNRRSRPILPLLKILKEGGIRMHIQMVVCPGINDGDALKDSVEDLIGLYPAVQTIALVPVGLTDWRQGLFPLRSFGRDEAREIIAWYRKLKRRLNADYGTCFVYPADEIWLKAQMPAPASQHYGDFAQLENGVGMLAKFREDFGRLKRRKKRPIKISGGISVISGKGPSEAVSDLLAYLRREWSLNIDLHIIGPAFMGKEITVTGLITGRDIIDYSSKHRLHKVVMVPDVMFKPGTDLLLDGWTLPRLARETGIDFRMFEPSPTGFLKELLKLGEAVKDEK
jgi:putative radical SAM enzyme (TIGR03279 family)